MYNSKKILRNQLILGNALQHGKRDVRTMENSQSDGHREALRSSNETGKQIVRLEERIVSELRSLIHTLKQLKGSS